MLDLRLRRTRMTKAATYGELSVNGACMVATLEDIVRRDPNPETPENEAKVYGETAIPAGRYKVEMTLSPKFKKVMPLVVDVPGFTGIRIHKGNRSLDTLGCILVGMDPKGDDWIGRSTEAWALLEPTWQRIQDGEEAWLTITDEFGGGIA